MNAHIILMDLSIAAQHISFPCIMASQRFDVSWTDSSGRNVLRHALLKDVPCAALATVTLTANTSKMTQEMIAHRFGQLPIGAFDAADGASPDGAVFTFDVNHDGGPSGDPTSVRWMTSHDLVLSAAPAPKPKAAIAHYRSAHEAAVAGDTGFLMVPLGFRQRVAGSATVGVSTARVSGTRWNCCFVVMGSHEVTLETRGGIEPADALRRALDATARILKAAADALVSE